MRSLLLFILLPVVLLPLVAAAQSGEFVEMVGIPFIDTKDQDSLTGYVNGLYTAAISIAAILAIIRLVMAGVQYMLSDVVTEKSQAKKGIRNALLGLIIVIAAVLILNTVNPEITKNNVFNELESFATQLETTSFRKIDIEDIKVDTSAGVQQGKTQLDQYDLNDVPAYQRKEVIDDIRESCSGGNVVVSSDMTATCRGVVTTAATDNAVNTQDNLSSYTASMTEAQKRDIETRYNDYIGPYEPPNMTSEKIREIESATGGDMVFIVEKPLPGTPNFTEITSQNESICRALTGSNNLVEVTSFAVCVK